MDRLGLPRANVLGYTLPGFATSARTLRNAHALMQALGVSAAEMDIKPSANQMLRDIGHPAADGGEPQYDVTYENVQAGERTSHLFRLANLSRRARARHRRPLRAGAGLVTYGVGDQMSHYNVNASVPKTLIRFLHPLGDRHRASSAPRPTPSSPTIVETAISPELIPVSADADHDGPEQHSEDTVGPYELQDFFLYYVLRFGYRPSKVAFLAQHAWGDRDARRLARPHPRRARATSTRSSEIRQWLEVFLHRFFQTSQFKRSRAAQRAQGRLRRLAVTALGLARAVRQRRPRRGCTELRTRESAEPHGLRTSAHVHEIPARSPCSRSSSAPLTVVDPDDKDADRRRLRASLRGRRRAGRGLDDSRSASGDVLAQLDPAVNNGSLAVAGALTVYLSFRRDELHQDERELIRLAVRAEWEGEPPAAVTTGSTSAT